jgi:hypothetical protein
VFNNFKRLSELRIGDKFWFEDMPYLVINLDTNNISLFSDFSNIKFALSLTTYKIIGFNENIEVVQDKDNFSGELQSRLG